MHAKRTQFWAAPGEEIEALAMPEVDSETSLTRRYQPIAARSKTAGDQAFSSGGCFPAVEVAPGAPG
jgi:hypothetical protein